jgi:hypothetical protein
MQPRIAMVLGRFVWTREPGGWRREAPDAGGATASKAVLRLSEILSERGAASTILIYEPSGMAHVAVETPRVSRTVFASLARIRSEHPVVASDGLGWGVEDPEPVPGGTYSTLLHCELTPGLAFLRDACALSASRLEAAWSVYTAAVACINPRERTPKIGCILVLLPGFVAVASCARGRRYFKAWTDPMAERDWKAFTSLIGDIDAPKSPSMADAELRRGAVAVIAEGPPGEHCPVWDQIGAACKVECLVDLEAVAAGAARIARAHPGNLVEAFPTAHSLDRYLAAIGVAGMASAVVFAAGALAERSRLAEDAAAGRTRAAALEARLDALNRNRVEMDALRNEAPEASGCLGPGVHEALLRLASAVPEALTLTSLELNGNDAFALEGIAAGPEFNAEDARSALIRGGFKPSSRDGWTFDAASGRLKVIGKFEEARP